MEIDYVDKLSILKSNRPVAEIIIAQDKLRFSIESNRNIFSINQIKKIDKGLNNDFKKLFANEITSKSPIELDIPNNSTPN